MMMFYLKVRSPEMRSDAGETVAAVSGEEGWRAVERLALKSKPFELIQRRSASPNRLAVQFRKTKCLKIGRAHV